MSAPVPLRRQQAEALASVDATWRGGRHAAWVVLPPGGGKTRLGLEAIALHDDPAVVLAPNTAVQSQWVAQARDLGMVAGETRDLLSPVSVLTYQSVALFTAGADRDEEDAATVDAPTSHLDRLHPHAADLVERLAALGPLTLVLDECHHLLDVWGELLVEVLDRLPQARILALTATPPETLSVQEARLVGRLFGDIVHVSSIPGFVRDGHLAPFRELVAFTEPTAAESTYLASTAERFAQIRTDLMTPGLTSVGLLEWLDERFVRRTSSEHGASGPVALTWEQLVRAEPDLTDAVLRASYAGLLALPQGAVLREQHRAPLDAQDWTWLLDDYIGGVLLVSDDPRDADILERIRAAVPGIGMRLTRRGLVRATSPVDRVVARSAAKALATVSVADLEWASRGDSLRLLVLCDFERASAQVPEGLVGVIEPEEGSARAVLRHLAADPATAGLHAVLVTARTVACSPVTADVLVAWLHEHDPGLDLRVEDDRGLAVVAGAWSSRRWVPLLTRWFEAGHGQVLVGTRALLGEGWDARRINVLVDLTTATTPMAVTQTRGRALRTDPSDPDKVAHTWTVVCVADEHPLGGRDYERFVRKHRGFFSVTDDGLITDGVAHVHPDLTPYASPERAERDRITREMRAAALDRDRTRELWRIGEPYDDEPVADLRVRAERSFGLDLPSLGPGSGAWAIVADTDGPHVRMRPRRSSALRQWLRGGVPDEDRDDATGLTLGAFAAAVADGLSALDLATRGADHVQIAPTATGSYRIWLSGVSEDVSQVFTDALDEVLSPLAAPRYVVPRYSIAAPRDGSEARQLAWRQLWRQPVPATVVWHAVPRVLATRRRDADAFARAWNHWVSPGPALFTGSPEGAGALAAQRGDDPFAVETATRLEWH